MTTFPLYSLKLILNESFRVGMPRGWIKEIKEETVDMFYIYNKIIYIKKPNKKELEECIEIFIRLNINKIIIECYNCPNIIPIGNMDFPFKKILLKNADVYDLSTKLARHYSEMVEFLEQYIKSLIIKEIYNNIDVFDNNDQFNKHIKLYLNKSIKQVFEEDFNKKYNKKYDNNNINDRLKIDIPFHDLKNILFMDETRDTIGYYCLYMNYIRKYSHLAHIYEYTLYPHINNLYYSFFNIMYLSYKHTNICEKLQDIINLKNDTYNSEDLIDRMAHDVSITIYNSNNEIPQYLFYEMKKLFTIQNDILYYMFISKNLKNIIKKCENKFIVLNIQIMYNTLAHANILIYNPNRKEVEIFEPSYIYNDKISTEELIYFRLVSILFGEDIKYVPQHTYILHNIQNLQELEQCNRGHCVSWCIWYADNRLKYPNLNAKEAFEQIINNNFKFTSTTSKIEKAKALTQMIDEYVHYIKKQRIVLLQSEHINEKERSVLMDKWFPNGFPKKLK